MKKHDEIMQVGADRARETMRKGHGGPFGAVIVKDGEIISVASNSVLSDNDPTAHAEVNAIRQACAKLGTYDLSGCTLYATGAPCPMCLGATIWSNIKEVYISGLPEDADEIGFRDNFMYHFIEEGSSDEQVLKMQYCDRSIARSLYSEYANNNQTIY